MKETYVKSCASVIQIAFRDIIYSYYFKITWEMKHFMIRIFL